MICGVFTGQGQGGGEQVAVAAGKVGGLPFTAGFGRLGSWRSRRPSRSKTAAWQVDFPCMWPMRKVSCCSCLWRTFSVLCDYNALCFVMGMMNDHRKMIESGSSFWVIPSIYLFPYLCIYFCANNILSSLESYKGQMNTLESLRGFPDKDLYIAYKWCVQFSDSHSYILLNPGSLGALNPVGQQFLVCSLARTYHIGEWEGNWVTTHPPEVRLFWTYLFNVK